MPRPWIVTRHDPVEEIDAGLWAVRGDVPGIAPDTGVDRRMHIVKLSDGRLAFHNAVPLDEAALAKVTAWGKPALLIVPNQFHRLDARAFREKLGLRVFAPGPVRAAVEKVVPVDGDLSMLPADPAWAVEPLEGTKSGEAVIRAGHSLIFADAVMNARPGKGLAALLFRLMGTTGKAPRISLLWKLFAMKDRAAVRAHLMRLAETPGLVRLVFSHGPHVSDDAAGALRRAAEAL